MGSWVSPSRRGIAIMLVAAALSTAAGARAELPPQVYRQRQAAAPEVLVIRVKSVNTKEAQRADHKLVTNVVEAVVEHVARTTKGLKRGAVITIVYTQRRYNQPVTGPSEVPSLDESQVRPAYLAWDKDLEAYSPAAGGYSFRKVDDKGDSESRRQ
jgi:hypothetical protein